MEWLIAKTAALFIVGISLLTAEVTVHIANSVYSRVVFQSDSINLKR
ncbi:hypothetical protein [Shewanella sp. OMA3-2]|nr:hypothetical protein [Shewanella sp. OMA3-2]UJF23128.1 hypothetical protein L0B17_07230 [Shewanella sp. OMA3-2]